MTSEIRATHTRRGCGNQSGYARGGDAPAQTSNVSAGATPLCCTAQKVLAMPRRLTYLCTAAFTGHCPAESNGRKIMTTKQTRQTVEAGKVAADQIQATMGEMNERAKGAMERSQRVVEE